MNEIQNKANQLKGNYQFKSPYHKKKKMLPFNVLGTISSNESYPIEVYTVTYRGYKKTDCYASYKVETIREYINSGLLTKQENSK